LASHFAALYGDLNLEPSKPVSISNGTNPEPSASQPQPEPEDDQGEEQAYEFRLFSTPSTTTATNPNPTVQKIILNDDEEDTGTGAFIHPRRPQSYYLHTPASGALKAEYEAAAVSGETVLAWREKRAWGLEVPWRVRTITVTSSLPKPSKSTSKPAGTASETASQARQGAVVGIEVSEEGKKKTKPSKKRRILLREKARKRSAAEEARRKIAQSKEEAEREKKTRRNREKKVKRKMKEKAKKGDTVGAVSVDGGDDVMGGVSH